MTTPPARPSLIVASHASIATLLCLAVAAPAVFGEMSEEMSPLLVPAAQLTPFLTALGLFFIFRPGRFATVFALRWGSSWRAIGVGLGVVIAIGLVQLGIGLLSGFTPAAGDAVTLAALAVPVVLVLQCVFAIGEELGWRGWLVTQLREKPFWLIASVASAAWVAWHLPALPLIVGDGGWEPGAAYLLAIASWAPFLVALRLWSDSVWPAVVVHGALNSIRVFLTQSIASGEGVNWIVEFAGAALWLVAAAALHSRARRSRAAIAAARSRHSAARMLDA